MKTSIFSKITVLILLVATASTAMAQVVFKTNKCRYEENEIVPSAYWQKTGTNEFQPLDADKAIMVREFARCSDFYLQISAGGAYNLKADYREMGSSETLSKENFGFNGEVILGHNWCTGYKSGMGIAVEFKTGVTQISAMTHNEEGGEDPIADLYTIQKGYSPYVGGGLALTLGQHSNFRVTPYSHANYIRMNAKYHHQGENGAYLTDKVQHSLKLDFGVRLMGKTSLTQCWGVDLGVSRISTKEISQWQVTAKVSYRLQKKYKSEPFSYRTYMERYGATSASFDNEAINEMRAQVSHNHNSGCSH